MADEPIFFQKAIHRVRFHEPDRNKWFVYYLHFLEISGELRRFFTGTGIQHFTGQALARLQVPLPPLPEQRRIVGILDEAFAGIARAVAATEKNLANARELFDCRLNGSLKSARDREGEVTLVSFCTFENGDRSTNYPSKKLRVASGVPFINAGHLTEGGIDIAQMDYISRATFDKTRPGDILFCLRGSLGKFASVGAMQEGAIASSLVFVRPGVAMLCDFLSMYFRSQLCADMIKQFANGAAQPNLSAASLKKFLVPNAWPAEQRDLLNSLSNLRSETQRLESLYRRKLAALAELRQALLQKAFAGELTSGDAAEAVA